MQDFRNYEREERYAILKNDLIDWYCRSMLELVSLECERAEFGLIILHLRRHFKESAYARLIFALSHITKPADYFLKIADDQATIADNVTKHTVPTQEVVSESMGKDKLARLWYLPHITEIILVD